MRLGVVILAAGQGSRMRSSRPKVLHHLGGKTLLAHVIDTARHLDPARIVVVHGHAGAEVQAAFAEHSDLHWVEQTRQLGTGHAMMQALPALSGIDQILVLYGDVPLIAATTLRDLVAAAAQGFGLLTVNLADPDGYGRICRDTDGVVQRIVEHCDADPEQLAIREVNTGIMCVPLAGLSRWLPSLSKQNSQSEYYLTDVLALAVGEGCVIQVSQPAQAIEAQGVNDRRQLAELERALQRGLADRLMSAGVTLRDPARIDIRGSLEHGEDVEIDINAVFEGRVRLGSRVRIGPNCTLRDVEIGDDVSIFECCVLEGARLDSGSRVGPFARLRPGAHLMPEARVGNFVEIKQALIGTGSKVNHLSYIGDAQLGAGVNIGAGTITCNYDGANKHKTIIGDDAFIGSNTALVAPVSIGTNATVGAGSVITKNAPSGRLSLTRARQVSMDWRRPTKKT